MAFNVLTSVQDSIEEFASGHSEWMLDNLVSADLFGDVRVFEDLVDAVDPESFSTEVNGEDGSFTIVLKSVQVSFTCQDVPGFFSALRHMAAVQIRWEEVQMGGEQVPVAVCRFVYSGLFQRT